jgi:hypothetical protein
MKLTEQEHQALNNLMAEHRRQIQTYKTIIGLVSIIAFLGWMS